MECQSYSIYTNMWLPYVCSISMMLIYLPHRLPSKVFNNACVFPYAIDLKNTSHLMRSIGMCLSIHTHSHAHSYIHLHINANSWLQIPFSIFRNRDHWKKIHCILSQVQLKVRQIQYNMHYFTDLVSCNFYMVSMNSRLYNWRSISEPWLFQMPYQ